jgi:hypothetical protein
MGIAITITYSKTIVGVAYCARLKSSVHVVHVMILNICDNAAWQQVVQTIVAAKYSLKE